ncbi:MAG: VCBS repeat-containing protein [Polyangiaceae bacterium]
MPWPLYFRSRLALVASFALLPACSCGDDTTTGGSGGTAGHNAGGQGGTGQGGTAGSTSSGFAGGAGGMSGCVIGDSCGDGGAANMGVCTEGDVCCALENACNAHCCADTEVCSFGACATPGITCADSTECPDGEYCEFSLGEPVPPPDPNCVAGAPVSTGKCLPKPPICPDGTEPDPNNPECLAACQVVPAFPALAPVLRYSWGNQVTSPFASDIMMTPIVIELDDDDCDGKITERDIPEIAFSTFSGGNYHTNGVLHAISIVEGQVTDKFSLPGVYPTRQLAAGNVDGMPGNEIIACMANGTVAAIEPTGTQLWASAPMSCFMPSIADLDGDGDVEVIVEGGILNGVDGQLEHAFSSPLTSSFVVSDVDGDGQLDVVTGGQVFHADGSLALDTGLAATSFFPMGDDWKSPWPAVADFDHDGTPEIVVVDNPSHTLFVWRVDGTQPSGYILVRAPVDINGAIPPSACAGGSWGNTHGGGPPTVADFTGDGIPDVAAAGGVGYVVFDGAKLLDPTATGPETILWIKPTVDCSSASTGSTVFDFNGDGVAEVIYADQQRLRVYDGPTGDVLWDTCNTTATLIENPVVADVDNDGHADIVAISNAYASGNPGIQCNDGTANGQSGVHVFGSADGSWVRTRRVWNEHAYHVTNVAEDGTIPKNELANYTQTGLDNFRQNKQPGSEFAAPDAVVSIAVRCTGQYGLVATVRNLGEAALPAGVFVSFYSGMPGSGTVLGQAITQTTLYPAESENVTLDLAPLDMGTVYAVVDDGGPPHPAWTECRTDNNTSTAVGAVCGVPQ